MVIIKKETLSFEVTDIFDPLKKIYEVVFDENELKKVAIMKMKKPPEGIE